MRVDDGDRRRPRRCRRDAVARLDFRALSGERFVALSLGTADGAPPAAAGRRARGRDAGGLRRRGRPAGARGAVDRRAGEHAERRGRAACSASLADVVEENRSALGDAQRRTSPRSPSKLDRGTGHARPPPERPDALRPRHRHAGRRAAVGAGPGRASRSNLRDGQGTLGKLLTQDDGLYDQVRRRSTTWRRRRATPRRSPTGCAPARARSARRSPTTRSTSESLDTLRTREPRDAVGRGPGADLASSARSSRACSEFPATPGVDRR